ncbi:hypothetical protein DH2020_017644 [Rehmannia glutinosa]|uniref:F-box domain-containing protein n=1 Tax=Rehmannia glutinosa TaxID=99300 RepID=A0ABR0WV07_REHGL
MPKRKRTSPMAVCTSSAPPWTELPRDLTANILRRLGVVDILENAQKVCTTWRTVCKDPAMWRVIDIRYNGEVRDCSMMCRHAVDLSQGQLIDLHMENFGDSETLLYVCKRSRNLRRLSLACCDDVSGKALTEAVKKLPQLEELHLIIMFGVRSRHLKTIGKSCPMLKSFTFNLTGHRHPHLMGTIDDDLRADVLWEGSEDEYFMEEPLYSKLALAIAKTMPNLCRLQLFANYMKNDGLQALLDGCPRLESLDIRQCFLVDLSGDLGKRCFKQIKNLRLPFDSVDDYRWDAAQKRVVTGCIFASAFISQISA